MPLFRLRLGPHALAQCDGRLLSTTSHTLHRSHVRLKLPRHQHRVLRTSAVFADKQYHPASPIQAELQTRQTAPTSYTQQTGIEQRRMHAGHSHGPGGHSHDTTYLTSTNKSDPGVRITRIGLYVNLGMAVCKGAGGVVFHSQALLADALHALTDLLSDITTLATISYSIKPATPQFPLGYGKIESIGALTVSGILLLGGIGIGLQAVLALSQQFFPEVFGMLSTVMDKVPIHSHSHGGGGHDHGVHVGPSIHAAWLAAGSILVKEWLYRATMKVAKEKRSSVLSSNAYHHRVDSLTAFVALFTIVASNFLEAARWLDPVGGLVISGMIVQAGWQNTKAAVLELADASVDAELRDSAHAAAADFLAEYDGGVATLRAVQGIKSGQNLMFDVEVVVPQDWSVGRCDEIETDLRAAIAAKVRGTKRVVIRFTTRDTDAFVDEFVEAHEEGEQHDHESHDGHAHGHDHSHSCDASHDHASGRTTAHSTGAKTNGTAERRR